MKQTTFSVVSSQNRDRQQMLKCFISPSFLGATVVPHNLYFAFFNYFKQELATSQKKKKKKGEL